VKHG